MSLWDAWAARPVGTAQAARQTFLDGRVVLHVGDSLDILDGLEANSIDSVCTDPPYHLTSVVKRFGPDGAAPAKFGTDGLYARQSRGFMNQTWDGGDIAFQPLLWAKVLRVLKPGGHMVAFSGTRTYHRMAVAIEDAGFEIRDQLAWVYGSGFPKSHNISKGIDKLGPVGKIPFADFAEHYEIKRKERGLSHADVCAHGNWFGSVNHGGTSVNFANGYAMPTVEQWPILQKLLQLDEKWTQIVKRVSYQREVIGKRKVHEGLAFTSEGARELDVTDPFCGAAKQWDGWGTALKPAWEPICLARKPLSEGTVVANVLAHGTGGLNVDGCRIGSDVLPAQMAGQAQLGTFERTDMLTPERVGRFPANLCHDGSPEVLAGFPETGPSKAAARGGSNPNPMDWGNGRSDGHVVKGHTDSGGSAARFFYCAKASKKDRAGSKHPTVKPVALIRWLARLVTPPGGTLLDPFAGSGTTGQAAYEEGFRAVLCEREMEYAADIAERMRRLSEP